MKLILPLSTAASVAINSPPLLLLPSPVGTHEQYLLPTKYYLSLMAYFVEISRLYLPEQTWGFNYH
jgi:hypothetical protein